MNPTNIKNKPSKIDNDFNTIDPILTTPQLDNVLAFHALVHFQRLFGPKRFLFILEWRSRCAINIRASRRCAPTSVPN